LIVLISQRETAGWTILSSFHISPARHLLLFKVRLGAQARKAIVVEGKIVNQGFKAFSIAIAVGALFSIAAPNADAQDVAATYVTGSEVPIKSNGTDVDGKTLDIKLQFAPAPGTELLVLRNTGPGIIRGRFNNLAQGQTIALNYSGITYHFVANYYGGNGNDLVLLWTTGDELVAPAARVKLDGQLLLAMRKARGEAPFDKPTTLAPDIPIKDSDRVLVDIDGSISKALVDQVTLGGGALPDDAASSTTLRAMVPISQLEALATRSDVTSIAPAKLSVTKRMEPQ
jgi:hypothetical protein